MQCSPLRAPQLAAGHRAAGARVKMGHGESNVPWGTRTAIAGARKLPKIRASNEIAIGLGLGFVGALPR